MILARTHHGSIGHHSGARALESVCLNPNARCSYHAHKFLERSPPIDSMHNGLLVPCFYQLSLDSTVRQRLLQFGNASIGDWSAVEAKKP